MAKTVTSTEEKTERDNELKLSKEQRLAQIRYVMDSPLGRAFVWDLISQAGFFQPCIVPGDHQGTDIALGQRNVALRVMAEIKASEPENYLRMFAEDITRQRKLDERSDD